MQTSNRIEFDNMGTDIYGEYEVKDGITSITKDDLRKAVIHFDDGILVITIHGSRHIVQTNKEFREFYEQECKYSEKMR